MKIDHLVSGNFFISKIPEISPGSSPYYNLTIIESISLGKFVNNIFPSFVTYIVSKFLKPSIFHSYQPSSMLKAISGSKMV